MKALQGTGLVVGVVLSVALLADAQTPAGALAIDERQGDQWGWAVDYETAGEARQRALSECGSGCSVVLTFARCAAYAADQESDSTAVGWGESYSTAEGARQRALSECGSRGGSKCTVRAWGCNGPVVEEGLGLDRVARQQVQEGLLAAGFDPGGADGMFGPRTRGAIRRWQSSRGSRATGYLDGASASALRTGGGAGPTVRAAQSPSPGGAPSAATAEQENLFWQSIMNSTNPAEFEAYLRRFPNGVFSELAQARLSALGAPPGAPVGRLGGQAADSSRPAASGAAARAAASAAVSADRAAGFRPDQTCAGQSVAAACWMEISGQPGCYVWNGFVLLAETMTWTGECAGGKAQGMGTLTWVLENQRINADGRLTEGKMTTGHWVIRNANNGNVFEGPYVDGEMTGHWVIRYLIGSVHEGPLVDGQRTGHWVERNVRSDVSEGPYVDGERHGHWVTRLADGTVEDIQFTNGEFVSRRQR